MIFCPIKCHRHHRNLSKEKTCEKWRQIRAGLFWSTISLRSFLFYLFIFILIQVHRKSGSSFVIRQHSYQTTGLLRCIKYWNWLCNSLWACRVISYISNSCLLLCCYFWERKPKSAQKPTAQINPKASKLVKSVWNGITIFMLVPKWKIWIF